MQVRDRDARRQRREVVVLLRHVRGGLGGQDVDLRSRDAAVKALHDSLRNRRRVDISRIEPITQSADALHDFVEFHCLVLPISLDDEHVHDDNKAGGGDASREEDLGRHGYR